MNIVGILGLVFLIVGFYMLFAGYESLKKIPFFGITSKLKFWVIVCFLLLFGFELIYGSEISKRTHAPIKQEVLNGTHS